MIAAIIRWSARNLLLVGFVGIFLTLAGLYAVSRVPLDAIPDLSDVQVIVYTEYPGQAPQVVEDQVTYPLTTAMLSVPKSRVVRGFSNFGVSFVYVIFEDGTDLYWARSRVLEYLNSAARRLPPGVTPSLGPDATIKAKNGTHDLEVEGAIFGKKHPRIVRVNNFYLEAVPEGYILVLHNKDVPGVVGTVGTVLGKNGINIAGMELGRGEKGDNAISFTHVDDAVPKSALDELRALPQMVSVDLVKL